MWVAALDRHASPQVTKPQTRTRVPLGNWGHRPPPLPRRGLVELFYSLRFLATATAAIIAEFYTLNESIFGPVIFSYNLVTDSFQLSIPAQNAPRYWDCKGECESCGSLPIDSDMAGQI